MAKANDPHDFLNNFRQERSLYQSLVDSVILSALPEVSRIIDSQTRLAASENLKQLAIIEQINSTKSSIAKLISSVDNSSINKLLQQSALQSHSWKQRFKATDAISGLLPRYDLALQAHLAEISKFSAFSQIYLSRLPIDIIGNALAASSSVQNTLQNSLTNFAKSYAALFASFNDDIASVISMPPVVSRYPSTEFFNAVSVTEVVTVEPTELEQNSEFEAEKHQIQTDIQQENESVLEELLEKLNIDLVILWQGARHSLESTNPDRVRHFASSLRELFTHVLHALAPDKALKDWTNSPKHYDRGRPTRRARLLYICRLFNHEPFSNFLEKDIDTVLEFLNLFQRGTHEIIPKYTDSQLKIMLIRMESTLRFLLEIWIANDTL